MRAEMATAEKQRKQQQQGKSLRSTSSFTLPRLRAFARKSHSVVHDDRQPQGDATRADRQQQTPAPLTTQRTSSVSEISVSVSTITKFAE